MTPPKLPIKKVMPRKPQADEYEPPFPTSKAQVQTPHTQAKVNWENVLNNLGSEGSGPFFFLKSSKTRIRILCFEDNVEQFFAMGTTVFQGKPKQKAIFFGTVISTEGRELSEKWANKIYPIVVTKTALKGILSILAEGYELFDPANGYGITILKSGKGTDTEYNVMPSPNPVPIDIEGMDMPEMSLVEYAELLTTNSAAKAGGATEGDW